ncbi:hypothetical protein [Nocardia aurantia]|uniref:Uncharacterized protein n=1 Tax=Nocardia aurantia TaxID=2585199 RepID=A0A7K0E2G8_9NOCA|nr:hypothetical protein [Nocardia aurantia]MQY31344.1 hypothetical protein [Nocardia aurantia]
MADHEAASAWLMNEAKNHLAEDFVGIFELLWLLRGSTFALTDEEAKQIARHTAADLLSTGEAELVHLRWPTNELVSTTTTADELNTPAAFEPTPTGEYLALSSTHP